MKTKHKMPNEGGTSSSSSSKCGHNTGKSTGLKIEHGIRPDTTKAPSNKNPYPHGLS